MTYYVFDIDGTLADSSERLKYICDENLKSLPADQKDWKKFYENVIEDKPIPEIVEICNFIFEGFGQYWPENIYFMTGRNEVCREDTLKWLHKYINFYMLDENLIMRRENDRTDDHILKVKWILDLRLNVIKNVTEKIVVFEDRKRIVDELRKLQNVRVLQVAEGNF